MNIAHTSNPIPTTIKLMLKNHALLLTNAQPGMMSSKPIKPTQDFLFLYIAEPVKDVAPAAVATAGASSLGVLDSRGVNKFDLC